MDSLIRRYDVEIDGDLAIAAHRGVAYQRDMTQRSTDYGADYWEKVEAYEGTAIAQRVNAGRVALVARHVAAGARVLDYGAGTGAFMRAALAVGFDAYGYEVLPEAVARLMAKQRWEANPGECAATTFWDVLEHLDMPELALKRVPRGAHVFVSLPIFYTLANVRESKHYRPGEHLYYWTPSGLLDWMSARGFRCIEESAHETAAGREAIGAFAFVKDAPDYHDHVAAYREMHATRYYGSSAVELHLTAIAEIVRWRKPRSILDYGCGRSDLVSHFWRDGERRLARFDPAIAQYESMPDGMFDLALCCDVMEHVPIASVDRVLRELRAKSGAVVFTISTKLARAKLPDGRNAHVTLLRPSEWVRWIESYWRKVKRVETKWEHELMLFAG